MWVASIAVINFILSNFSLLDNYMLLLATSFTIIPILQAYFLNHLHNSGSFILKTLINHHPVLHFGVLDDLLELEL